MVTVTLIRGIKDKDKTNLAKKMLVSSVSTLYYEADMFLPQPCYDTELVKNAHKLCLKKTRQAVANEYNVIVLNNFSQLWEMKPYLKLAGKNVQVKVIKYIGRTTQSTRYPWENYPDEQIIRY